MEPSIRYKLPTSLRDELRKPFGKLLSGEEFNQQVHNFEYLFSIGDFLSCSLLKQHIYPNAMVIDYQTKRKQINDKQKQVLENPKYQTIKVKNPAGVITNELWNTIKQTCQSFQSDSYIQIQVEGEEDLAALPAILYAPTNVTIIYGMPDKGVVVAQSTDNLKEKVRNILTKM